MSNCLKQTRFCFVLVTILLAVPCRRLGHANNVIETVNTISDLVALNPPGAGTSVFVRGYRSPGDGGQGLFDYHERSTVATNSGTCLKPRAANGRWHRQYAGPQNALWYGAYRDGSNPTPTTIAIQAAIDAAAGFSATASDITAAGSSVFIPHGLYAINDVLWIGKSNVANINYTVSGDGRESTKLVWTGSAGGPTNKPMLVVCHPLPSPVNINTLTIKDLGFENPSISNDRRTPGVEGLRLIGNAAPATIGPVGGINRALLQNLRFAGLDNGIHLYTGINESIIERCDFSAIYHQLTTVTASLTDPLTDRRGNCIIADGDYDNTNGVASIIGQLWMRNNVFNGYQAHSVDIYRVSQFTFSENAIYMNHWKRSRGVRVQQGSGGYVSGNFTQSENGDSYGPLFYLNSAAAGSSAVNGYSIIGNSISGPLNATSDAAGVELGVVNGGVIVGNSFNYLARAIKLSTTCTNIFIGVNDYTGISTAKLTDLGAKNLHIIDAQLGSRIADSLTFGDDRSARSLLYTFANGGIGTVQRQDSFYLLGGANPGSAASNIIFNASSSGGFSFFADDSQSASILRINGGIVHGYVTTARSLSIGAMPVFYISVTANGQSIILPAARSVSAGRTYVIKSAGADVTTTVARTGGDTIDNMAADDLLGPQKVGRYISDGTLNWEKW